MMQPIDKSNVNRRQFLQHSGTLAAGAAVLGSLSPTLFAAGDDTIRLALIGCGGRGTGAVGDALSVPNGGPVKLYAMADLDPKRMEAQRKALQEKCQDKIDVVEDRKFVGFRAYRQAIDCLRPGDVAMCTTRAYIRPVHVEYAIRKGINVFMEKPFASDPGGLHRLLRAGEEAEK
jgi:predicted dehydrogenase